MTEHKLPNLIVSSRSESLEAVNFSNSVSLSDTSSGSLIETATKLGDTTIIFEGGTISGSTVIVIIGSLPGHVRGGRFESDIYIVVARIDLKAVPNPSPSL